MHGSIGYFRFFQLRPSQNGNNFLLDFVKTKLFPLGLSQNGNNFLQDRVKTEIISENTQSLRGNTKNSNFQFFSSPFISRVPDYRHYFGEKNCKKFLCLRAVTLLLAKTTSHFFGWNVTSELWKPDSNNAVSFVINFMRSYLSFSFSETLKNLCQGGRAPVMKS
jgi:hypothetical protein